MVILDHDLPYNTAPMIIQIIKLSWPDIRCVVLVNDDQGCQEMLDKGADLSVVKGLPGGNLVPEIEKFLRPQELYTSMSTGSGDEIQIQEGA